MKLRSFLLFAACCLAANAAVATDYYVDATKGSDSADGKSPATAWKTLDRVNDADELVPGDVVRFKSGEVFRGGLKPHSGDPGAPITYTSYGEGLKPSLWRSVALDKESDWVKMGEERWATRGAEVRELKTVELLGDGNWALHQENGAKVSQKVETVDGAKVYRFRCDSTGSAGNHIQWFKSGLSIEKDACYLLSFDIKASKPCALSMRLSGTSAPWPSYGTVILGKALADVETSRCAVAIKASQTADDARVTFYMGGIGDDIDIEIANFETKLVEVDALELGPDVGNIILDGNKAAFKRWFVDDVLNDDGKVKLPGIDQQDDFVYDRGTGRVWFNSKENPAKAHKSIEAAVMRHVVDHSNVHDAIFDGLDIRYGAAHGFGGSNSKRLVIRNCDIAWIGGGDQYQEGGEGRRTRFGNGVEFWSAAEDNVVENNRIWEVYDAALTNQGSGVNTEKNIVYRNNVIWNCEYSFEYWNRDEESITENVLFEDNYCLNAGFGWGHAQRPDRNGRCLMFYSNTAQTKNFVVKNNVFANATESLVRSDKAWTPEQPQLSGNIYWQDPDAFEKLPAYVRWVGAVHIDADAFKTTYQNELGQEKDGKIQKVDVEKLIPTDIR